MRGEDWRSVPCITDIGARIRKLRLERGMSQSDLADLTGLTRGRISNWEIGRGQPGLRGVAKLCLHLDVPLSSFFRGLKAEDLSE